MPPHRKPAVALVSDHILFRQLVAQRLADKGDETVLQLGSTDRLADSLQNRNVDIVIVDHDSEGAFEVVRTLRNELPGIHVIVLATPLRQTMDESVLETEGVDRAIAVTELVPALRAGSEERPPHKNWSRITARQRDVMRWLAMGLDNAAIGQKLRIGERAVKAHVSSLLALFGLQNRTQLALLADRAGLRPLRR